MLHMAFLNRAGPVHGVTLSAVGATPDDLQLDFTPRLPTNTLCQVREDEDNDESADTRLTASVALGVPFGLLAGTVLGLLLDNIGLGIGVGLPLGAVVGALVFHFRSNEGSND
jgi:hypothetical protein